MCTGNVEFNGGAQQPCPCTTATVWFKLVQAVTAGCVVQQNVHGNCHRGCVIMHQNGRRDTHMALTHGSRPRHADSQHRESIAGRGVPPAMGMAHWQQLHTAAYQRSHCNNYASRSIAKSWRMQPCEKSAGQLTSFPGAHRASTSYKKVKHKVNPLQCLSMQNVNTCHIYLHSPGVASTQGCRCCGPNTGQLPVPAAA